MASRSAPTASAWPLPSSPTSGPKPPTRAVRPSFVRPRQMEPVPLMSATPKPSGVPQASTSSESFSTENRGATACSRTQLERRVSSSRLSMPARPKQAAARRPERQAGPSPL